MSKRIVEVRGIHRIFAWILAFSFLTQSYSGLSVWAEGVPDTQMPPPVIEYMGSAIYNGIEIPEAASLDAAYELTAERGALSGLELDTKLPDGLVPLEAGDFPLMSGDEAIGTYTVKDGGSVALKFDDFGNDVSLGESGDDELPLGYSVDDELPLGYSGLMTISFRIPGGFDPDAVLAAANNDWAITLISRGVPVTVTLIPEAAEEDEEEEPAEEETEEEEASAPVFAAPSATPAPFGTGDIAAGGEFANAVTIDNMVLKKSGSVLNNGDTVFYSDILLLRYDFSVNTRQFADIKEALKTHDSITYNITLPAGLLPKEASSAEADIMMTDGNLKYNIGQVSIVEGVDGADGRITVTFSDPDNFWLMEVDPYDEIEAGAAFIEVTCSLNKTLTEGKAEYTIKITDSQIVTVKIGDNLPAKHTLFKSGEYSAADGKFHWTVIWVVGDEGYPLTLTDIFNTTAIPDKNHIIDSADSVKSSVDGFSPIIAEEPEDRNSFSIEIAQKPMVDGKAVKQVTFTYETILIDDVQYVPNPVKQTVGNTVMLKSSDDNGGTVNLSATATATAVADDLKWMGKYGVTRGNAIDWTITVNTGRGLSELIVYDKFDDSLVLDGSVKVNGNPISAPMLGGKGVYDEGGANEKDYSFSVNFGTPGNNKTHVITYSTIPVPEDVEDPDGEKDYDNEAWLSFKWAGGGTGGWNEPPSIEQDGTLDTNIIRKQSKGYDAAAQEITWQITVNPHKVHITEGTITDVLEKGQKFVKVVGLPSEITHSNAKDATSLLFTVGELTETRTFDIVTKVTDAADHGANNAETYSNTAKFKGDVRLKAGGLREDIECESTATCQVISNVLEKKVESYNYTNNQVTWELIVNKNKMEMTNAIVTETIPVGQTLESYQRIGIDNAPVTSGITNNVNAETTHEIRLSDPDDTIDSQITVLVVTKVDTTVIADFKSKSSVTVENNAELTFEFDGEDYSERANAEKVIANKVLDKTGKRSGSSITYTVGINPNGIPLPNDFTIMDAKGSGSEEFIFDYEDAYFNLYRATVDEKGVLSTVGAPLVKGTDYTLGSATDTSFSLTIKAATLGAPYRYILEYDTYFTKPTGTYINNISFTAAGFTGNDFKDSQSESVSGADAGGSAGKKTRLNITLTDSARPDVGLAGVTYKIYEVPAIGPDVLIATLDATTGDNGKKTDSKGETSYFPLKRNTTYRVEQTDKSDNSYTIPTEYASHTISTGDNATVSYNPTNDPAKSGSDVIITVTGNDKADLSDYKALGGVIYTIAPKTPEDNRDPDREPTDTASASDPTAGTINLGRLAVGTYELKVASGGDGLGKSGWYYEDGKTYTLTVDTGSYSITDGGTAGTDYITGTATLKHHWKTGTITVNAYRNGDTAAKISGVELALTAIGGPAAYDKTGATSGGKVEFTGLPHGYQYKLQEDSSTAVYKEHLPNIPYTPETGYTTVTMTSNIPVPWAKVPYIGGSKEALASGESKVVITLADEDRPDVKLNGVTFKLKQGTTEITSVTGTGLPEFADGQIVFATIPGTAYEITQDEVAYPTNYGAPVRFNATTTDYALKEAYSFTSAASGTLQLPVTNRPERAENIVLKITGNTKEDLDTYDMLSGVTYKITEKTPARPGYYEATDTSAVDGADAKITLATVPFGTFLLEATNYPADTYYDMAQAKYTLIVSEDGSFELYKGAPVDGEKPAGAEEITDSTLQNEWKTGTIEVDVHKSGTNPRAAAAQGLKIILSGGGANQYGGTVITGGASTGTGAAAGNGTGTGKVKFENLPFGYTYTITEDADTTPYSLYLPSPTSETKTFTAAQANGHTLNADWPKIPYLGGSQDNPTGNEAWLVVTLEDELRPGKFLSGGKFELYQGAAKIAEATTGPNGIVTFALIPNTSYTLKETTIPTDYKTEGETIKVKSQSLLSEYSISKAGGSSTSITVTNEPMAADVTFQKTGTRDSVPTPLEGAKFTLTETGVTGRTPYSKEVSSLDDGSVTFPGVPVGNYELTEESAPDGYVKDENTYTVEVKVTAGAASSEIKNGAATVDTIDNAYFTGKITVTRYIRGTTTKLTGIGYQLLDADSNVVASGATNDSGVVVFSDIPYAQEFTIHELDSAGYLPTEDIPVTITGSSSGIDVPVDWPKIPYTSPAAGDAQVQITLTDVTRPTLALTGATFELRDHSGGTPTVVASSSVTGSGELAFAIVPGKYYSLEQTVYPSGYTDAKTGGEVLTTYTFKATANGEVVALPVTNKPPVKPVRFYNENDVGLLLSGGVFTITENGGTYTDIETGSNGTVDFGDVPYGNYSLEQTTTPSYHEDNDTTYTLTVNGSGFTITGGSPGDFTDPDIILNVTTKEDLTIHRYERIVNTDLNGVEYEVSTESFTATYSGTTSGSGEVTLTIPVSYTYTVKEKSTEPQYLPTAPKTIPSFAGDATDNTLDWPKIPYEGPHPADIDDGETRLDISLTDELRPSRALTGAAFQLWQEGGGAALASGNVDADGKLTFAIARGVTYYLKQTAHPATYGQEKTKINPQALSDYKFSAPSTETRLSLPVTNKPPVQEVRFGNINDLGEDLTGVRFQITEQTAGDDGCYPPTKDGDAGKVDFGELPYGTYTLTETRTIDLHRINDTEYTLIVDENGFTIEDNAEPLDEMVIVNEIIRGTLTINRHTREGNKPLSGTEYTVTGNFTGANYTGTTSSGGLAVFENLPLGKTYTLSEGDSTGYLPTADMDYLMTAPDSIVNWPKVAYSDPGVTGDTVLIVTIQDRVRPGVTLSQVPFQLLNPAGDVLAEAETDGDGQLIFNISPGTIYSLAAVPPRGYSGPAVGSVPLDEFTVSRPSYGAENVLVTVAPAMVPLSFTVRNDIDRLVPGATYILTDTTTGSTYSVTVTSDANGVVDFGMVPFGVYSLQEVDSAVFHLDNGDEYLVDAEPEGDITVTDPRGEELPDMELPTVIMRGSVTITHYDRNSGDPIPGQQFTIVDARGNVVGTGYTDENGQIVFDGLIMGDNYAVVMGEWPGGAPAPGQMNVDLGAVDPETGALPTNIDIEVPIGEIESEGDPGSVSITRSGSGTTSGSGSGGSGNGSGGGTPDRTYSPVSGKESETPLREVSDDDQLSPLDTLPNTGQNWLLPILTMAAGIVLVAFSGWRARKQKRKNLIS